jgi:3-oxoacyl-[acyl-carrier protein] reductase
VTSSGRVAVVTGGGRGIGAAISRRLAADGHAVVVNFAHSKDQAEAVVECIRSDGGVAEAVRADVADPADVEELFATAAARLGAPTIVVNNAGLSVPSIAKKQTVDQWDRMVAVNLSAAFYCTRAGLDAMYDAGWGRVVLLGSPGGGRTIAVGMTAYGAAKAGLVQLGRCLALETAGHGITVNTIVPGFVETDMSSGGGGKSLEELRALWPEVPPEAIAATVSFLVSDDAAYISGEDIAVWRGGPTPFARPRGD